jgi:hypothetical protein
MLKPFILHILLFFQELEEAREILAARLADGGTRRERTSSNQNPIIDAMSLIAHGYESESEEDGEIEHGSLKKAYIETKLRAAAVELSQSGNSSEHGNRAGGSLSKFDSVRDYEVSDNKPNGPEASEEWKDSEVSRRRYDRSKDDHHKERTKSRDSKHSKEKELHVKDEHKRSSSRHERTDVNKDQRSSVSVKGSNVRNEKAVKESDSKHNKDKLKDASRVKAVKERNEDTKHYTDSIHRERSGRVKSEKDRVGHHQHTSRDKDRERRKSGSEREKIDKDSKKVFEEKAESRREHRHSGILGEKKADAHKESSRLNTVDMYEPEAMATDELRSLASPGKQLLHRGSSAKPVDIERHSSPIRNRHSHSRASPSIAR